MARQQLLSPARTRRTLVRLAYEVLERNRGASNVLVFGIRRRGTALAEQMAATLSEVEGARIEAHPLDIGPFRDDHPTKRTLDENPPEVADRDVLIVDDVLFSGRTARAAIDAVLHLGRPRSIQLAVLVDRGHREVPIRPDFLGLQIPTKHEERVVVEVEEPAVYLEE